MARDASFVTMTLLSGFAVHWSRFSPPPPPSSLCLVRVICRFLASTSTLSLLWLDRMYAGKVASIVVQPPAYVGIVGFPSNKNEWLCSAEEIRSAVQLQFPEDNGFPRLGVNEERDVLW